MRKIGVHPIGFSEARPLFFPKRDPRNSEILTPQINQSQPKADFFQGKASPSWKGPTSFPIGTHHLPSWEPSIRAPAPLRRQTWASARSFGKTRVKRGPTKLLRVKKGSNMQTWQRGKQPRKRERKSAQRIHSAWVWNLLGSNSSPKDGVNVIDNNRFGAIHFASCPSLLTNWSLLP